jgi:hypothetical protein
VQCCGAENISLGSDSMELDPKEGLRRLIFYHFWSSETLVWIRIRLDSPKSPDPDPDTSKSTDNDPDPDAMKYEYETMIYCIREKN